MTMMATLTSLLKDALKRYVETHPAFHLDQKTSTISIITNTVTHLSKFEIGRQRYSVT
jgi:hypothetical protein